MKPNEIIKKNGFYISVAFQSTLSDDASDYDPATDNSKAI